MATLIISVDRVKEIAKHASSELPKGMDADVYAKEVCNTMLEIILHQIIQKAYYDGIIASEQRYNEQLKEIREN